MGQDGKFDIPKLALAMEATDGFVDMPYDDIEEIIQTCSDLNRNKFYKYPAITIFKPFFDILDDRDLCDKAYKVLICIIQIEMKMYGPATYMKLYGPINFTDTNIN